MSAASNLARMQLDHGWLRVSPAAAFPRQEEHEQIGPETRKPLCVTVAAGSECGPPGSQLQLGVGRA